MKNCIICNSNELKNHWLFEELCENCYQEQLVISKKENNKDEDYLCRYYYIVKDRKETYPKNKQKKLLELISLALDLRYYQSNDKLIKDFRATFMNEVINCDTEEKNEEDILKTKQMNVCACGNASGKYDLCYDCYRIKMENNPYTKISKEDMTSFIESEKDSGIDIRKKWPPKIRCEDGRYVRSHAECRIADWLRNHNIQFDYEKKVLSKSDTAKFLLSDFYIPDAKLYIEYWGYKDKETYIKRRNEKIEIYKENNLIWEDLEDTHLEVLSDAMTAILIKYFPNIENNKK